MRNLLCLEITVYAWAQSRPYRKWLHERGQVPSMFSLAAKLVAHQPLLPRHQAAIGYLVLLCNGQEFQHQSQATSYSHTYGKDTSAKQAPKTWPTGTSQPSRLPKAGHQACVPTGITCGKGMTKGALQPFSQSSGSHPRAFFSLLVDGCRFRAFPSPNQWATCQPPELCKRSALRGCQAWGCRKRTQGCSCSVLRR